MFGVPDRRLGEKICATIRIQKNTNLKVEDIKNYCKGKVRKIKLKDILVKYLYLNFFLFLIIKMFSVSIIDLDFLFLN